MKRIKYVGVDALVDPNAHTYIIGERKNMQNQFSRTELLIGEESIKKINKAKVAVFGIGGVGSYVVSAW